MMGLPTPGTGLRLAELMAAMSIATDLGMGQPPETALSTCIVAVRLGEALNLGTDALRDIYYLALLRHIGCNAETHLMAALFGDELALRRDFSSVDPGQPAEVMEVAARHIREAVAAEPPLVVDELVAVALRGLPDLIKETFAGHCEVAKLLAGRLGLPGTLTVLLGQLFERWDGRGLPRGLIGEEIAPAVMLVTLSHDAVVWNRLGGSRAAAATLRKRGGQAFPPGMVERFCTDAAGFLSGLDEEPTWEWVLALEPGTQDRLSLDDFERACTALADFADLKSPYTVGHSAGVARLAAAAGRRAGLIDADVALLWQAGLLHDIGRSGVSAGIWGKPGPLSDREREQVRLHPYFTERVLARSETLGRIGALASQHHERLDGSGYHRSVAGNALSVMARILAAADAYQAMTEPRPHRPALAADQAADELRREVRAGRLDGDAVHVILAEAGHRVAPTRRERPAGLSRREVEVLRLVARGLTTQDIAVQLFLSADTVKHHIRHIYNKTGLNTRAGATLFAMEHFLL